MKFSFLFLFFITANFCFSKNDTIRVAVYDKDPFGYVDKDEYKGLMIEIWEDIAKEMGLTYQYKLVKMDELLAGIHSRQYDVGLGAISITPEREELVDFTHVVNPSGTTIGVSKNLNKVSFYDKWGPILVNLFELIAFLILMLLSAATLVWLVEKKYMREHKDEEKGIKTIADGLWWSAVTMTTVGYGDKVPMSRFGKFIGIVWIFTSIIFFSLFTANASAKLTETSKAKAIIKTVDDLYSVNVVSVANSSGEAFLKREGVHYSTKPTLSEAIQSVINKENDAIVYNAPVLKYYNKKKFQNKLIVSNHYLLKNNMAIALQPNSDLQEEINRILLQKVSEPKWQAAVYKYIGD